EWREIGKQNKSAREAWTKRKDASKHAREFDATMGTEYPKALAEALAEYKVKVFNEKPSIATRKASEGVLEAINGAIPYTVGGSADLTPSNNTKTKGLIDIKPGDFSGRYVRYGIREHGMAAAMSGMALHGGIIPYGGTFMVFSDYCRPSIRLAA